MHALLYDTPYFMMGSNDWIYHYLKDCYSLEMLDKIDRKITGVKTYRFIFWKMTPWKIPMTDILYTLIQFPEEGNQVLKYTLHWYKPKGLTFNMSLQYYFSMLEDSLLSHLIQHV